MVDVSLDRLVRKEESLGAIREMPIADNLIGLQIAPFLSVVSDDVIFEYIRNGLQEGLAPARAEDAEAELAQKDQLLYGQGRASIIDWALKDRYSASDVTRYRDDLLLVQQAQGVLSNLNFNAPQRTVDDFNARVARHDALRRRKLDLRIEWLILTGLSTGRISYNDGKIKFTVDYGRPANQNDQAPTGGTWGTGTSDPIGDLLAVNQYMLDHYGFKLTKGMLSTRVLNNIWKSDRFLAALGMPVLPGNSNVPLDPNYMGLSGYTPEGALRVVESATGIQFSVYDGFWRTRPVGSSVFTNNRFTPDDQVILYPAAGDLGDIDSTEVGFAKTLTSPHPEGNWSSGFYEWEAETRDPWMHVRGTGVKAFPVFPYMEYTYTMRVL